MTETPTPQPAENQYLQRDSKHGDPYRDHNSDGDGGHKDLVPTLRSLPPDLLTLFMEGRRVVRQDQYLKARPIFERFEESVALRGMEYGQTLIDPLLECVGTLIVLGNLVAVRETFRVCYALAPRLKRLDRVREGFNIQALHSRWHSPSEDLAGAIALCGDAVGLGVLPGPLQDKRIWYSIQATEIFRRLGLHYVALKLLQALETPIGGDINVTELEMRIAILVCRLHILGFRSGMTARQQGPLGWERSEPQRVRAETGSHLARTTRNLQEVRGGRVTALRRLRPQHGRRLRAGIAADHAKLLDLVTEQLRQFEADGCKPLVQEALIDLASLQINDQLFGRAAGSLDQARALLPLDVGPLVVAERWHWLNHRASATRASQSARWRPAWLIRAAWIRGPRCAVVSWTSTSATSAGLSQWTRTRWSGRTGVPLGWHWMRCREAMKTRASRRRCRTSASRRKARPSAQPAWAHRSASCSRCSRPGVCCRRLAILEICGQPPPPPAELRAAMAAGRLRIMTPGQHAH